MRTLWYQRDLSFKDVRGRWYALKRLSEKAKRGFSAELKERMVKRRELLSELKRVQVQT